MNKQQFDNLWESCRDGTISDADRAAFEAHLHENESAAALWRAESQWLDLLGDVDGAAAQEPTARSGEAFASGVIEQWQLQQEREALGVVAVIGPATAQPGWRRFAGIAAMIALLLGSAIYVASLGKEPQGSISDDGKVAVLPPVKDQPSPKAVDTAPEAIGLLLASAKESYAVAAAQPGRWRQGLSDTAAMLDVAHLASLLDPGVPDPAAFVTPRQGG